MTILIYDYQELEERASQHLKAWKVWHLILYVLAAIFGILNYTFLFQTEQLFNNRCVLYPRNISLHWIPKLPINSSDVNNTKIHFNFDNTTNEYVPRLNVTAATTSEGNETIAQTTTTAVPSTSENKRDKREQTEFTTTEEEVTLEKLNGTMITENSTHRKVVDQLHTLLQKDSDSRCQFAEYMPLLSAVFAIVWTTLFIMCPKGGRTRTGLSEPWRILAPAFIFAFVMVILTGYSFASTNGGLGALCAAFQNYTNSTNCSAVNRFIESSNSSWSISGRISATRAASAGVWASWTCACALLLARCIVGADFVVKHTAVHLVRDPQQKVTPFLQKQNSSGRSQRSSQNSPSKRDAASVKSEPTATTELVTVTVEHEGRELDSQPTSLAMTPMKDKLGEELEMTQPFRKMGGDQVTDDDD